MQSRLGELPTVSSSLKALRARRIWLSLDFPVRSLLGRSVGFLYSLKAPEANGEWFLDLNKGIEKKMKNHEQMGQ
jgi:hypothetical protein